MHETSETVFKSLVTAYQTGAIVGSLVFGVLAFIIGRRKIFIVNIFFYLDNSNYLFYWSNSFRSAH